MISRAAVGATSEGSRQATGIPCRLASSASGPVFAMDGRIDRTACFRARCRCGAVVFQIGVALPDQRSHMLLGGTLVVGERVELVYQPLCVHPTQRMLTDRELASAVTDNHALTQKIMRPDAAP